MTNTTSAIDNKSKIQQLIDRNIVRASGDFHSDSFDEFAFIQEVNKKFKITPKQPGDNFYELFDRVIKKSMAKVRGRFNSKELNKNKFIKELFENFEINKL